MCWRAARTVRRPEAKTDSVGSLVASNYPDAMSFTVTYENRPIAIHENTVGPRQLAFEWIVVRAIAELSGARNCHDGGFLRINHANHIVFRIRQINITVWRDIHALRAGKRGILRRPTVSREAFLSRAGGMVDQRDSEVELQNRVAFTQRHPEITAPVKIERA